jgi:hypothetical protein
MGWLSNWRGSVFPEAVSFHITGWCHKIKRFAKVKRKMFELIYKFLSSVHWRDGLLISRFIPLRVAVNCRKHILRSYPWASGAPKHKII